MSYASWFDRYAKRHKKIVDKLLVKDFTQEQIVDYFSFENMLKEEPKFCPLYQKNKKCHDMEKLNCYLCACPNFRFNDVGLEIQNDMKVLSRCEINNGAKVESKGVIHHSCSTCTVPHHKEFIVKNFDTDWKNIMNKCNLNEV